MKNELCHYGILGMKWGMHRAAKKGTSYTYRSLSQKRLQRRVNNLAKAGKSGSRKYADALENLKTQRLIDKNRVAYAKDTKIGSVIARRVLMTPFYADRYERMRALGMAIIPALRASRTRRSFLEEPFRHAERRFAKSGYKYNNERSLW